MNMLLPFAQDQMRRFYQMWCPDRIESAQEVAKMYASDLESLNQVSII